MNISNKFKMVLVGLLVVAPLAWPNPQPALAVLEGSGGTITHSGGYTIHTFTSSGTFTPPVTSGGITVEYLIIGGGGGGGNGMGGGGGGGGFVDGAFTMGNGAHQVVVGAGGGDSSQGGSSSVNGVTAPGGGAGGSWVSNGGSGGSGGGAGGGAGDDNYGGNPILGGNGGGGSVDAASGGGGGGAGAPGGDAEGDRGGSGGGGASSTISGTYTIYSGGGAGAGQYYEAYNAGSGGGGRAYSGGCTALQGDAGVPNTGGGGGGGTGCGAPGGNGGSGIVIVRYVAPPGPHSTCTSTTPNYEWKILSDGTYYVYANGVSNATSVYFPTWSDDRGQDDIIWYAGTNLGGGVWRATINLSYHAGIPNDFIYTHVYMNNAEWANDWCGAVQMTLLNAGTIQVDSNLPTSWTITCTLTNPACPNITSSGGLTSGTYTNKPYSTWSITPAAISGYNMSVTPSNSQGF